MGPYRFLEWSISSHRMFDARTEYETKNAITDYFEIYWTLPTQDGWAWGDR